MLISANPVNLTRTDREIASTVENSSLTRIPYCYDIVAFTGSFGGLRFLFSKEKPRLLLSMLHHRPKQISAAAPLQDHLPDFMLPPLSDCALLLQPPPSFNPDQLIEL